MKRVANSDVTSQCHGNSQPGATHYECVEEWFVVDLVVKQWRLSVLGDSEDFLCD